MSRRNPLGTAESRPSLSRNVRMALSYLALFVFTLFALYPISRVVTIALRPGDQLLTSSLAMAKASSNNRTQRARSSSSPQIASRRFLRAITW